MSYSFDHGSVLDGQRNACLVCAMRGAIKRRTRIDVCTRLSKSLILALRGNRSTDFMMPTCDTSTSVVPVIADAVLSYLISCGVRSLTILVDGRVYHSVSIDGDGIPIAINLVRWVHWVEWAGPLPNKGTYVPPKGLSLARTVANHRIAQEMAAADEALLFALLQNDIALADQTAADDAAIVALMEKDLQIESDRAFARKLYGRA